MVKVPRNTDNTDSFGDDLDREVQPFRFEKDDRLVGRVVSIEWVDSKYSGEQYPLVEIDVGDIIYAWHAAQAVARSAIRRKNPRPGDRIGIKCLGPHPTKNYVDYRIIVEHEHEHERAGELPVDEPPPDDFA